MIIERTNQPGREYYEEVVNIQAQYRSILRNPNRKTANVKFRCLCALGLMGIVAVLVLFLIVGGYHFSTFETILYTFDGILTICTIIRLLSLNKAVNEYMKHPGKTVYTLDETQIQYESQYTTYKLPWENILEARVLKNSIIFVGNKEQPILFSFEKKDGLLAFNYMKKNNIQVFTVQ